MYWIGVMPMTDGGVEDGGWRRMEDENVDSGDGNSYGGVRSEGGSQEREMGMGRDSRISRTTQ